MKSNFEVNLILFACLFLFINSSQKSIFDETQLKYLKLKNRIFRGSVGDTSFKDCHISEDGFKLYDDLSKNEVGLFLQGIQLFLTMIKLIIPVYLEWIKMNIFQNLQN